ncbi:MAG: TonB-dependent receptor [Gammaproteobacteria bacterium]|nr:TonB-dependent receptor [Gammaproteobacteria bacterium]
MKKIFYNLLIITLLAVYSPVYAGETEELRQIQEELMNLSLADLLNVEVTSVTKQPQKLSESAAAIFVISKEDIRRSGAAGIADLLRMAPGLQVTRFNSHAWAVTARGFNGFYASKLLVLVDGRSVYNTEFSGVYWDTVDTVLEDIERIEIIRGPGGALWGANAVNGIINIITKHAQDTQGNLLALGAGNEEKSFARFRRGGMLNKSTWYRVYAKTLRRGALAGDFADNWQVHQGGFRLDAHPDLHNSWTIQGDIFDGEENDVNFQTLESIKTGVDGINLLSRWVREFSSDSKLTAQAYYDASHHDVPINAQNRVFDFDLQHRFSLGKRQTILWGLGYRRLRSDIPDQPHLKFNPPLRKDNLFSLFMLDEITVFPKKFTVSLGSKLEYNDYTGLEVQPNIRLLWLQEKHRTLWAAVSRAVRTPSRIDHDVAGELTVPPAQNPIYPMPLLSRGIGDRRVKSEVEIAYEAGMRTQLNPRLSLDIAAFFNRYDNAVTNDQIMFPSADNRMMILQSRFSNGLEGKTYGFELALDWMKAESWRLQAAYSFLRMHLRLKKGVQSLVEDTENRSPRHQLSLRSSLTLSDEWELDLWCRYVDELPSEALGYLDDYVNMDVRLAWRPSANLELSLTGQNLLDKQHPEFGPDTFNPFVSEVQRGAYGQLRWTFE